MLLPSTGTELELFTSKNGCRRCDVHVEVEDDDTERKDGWMKLMEQNVGKSSAAAARARAGAKIVRHNTVLCPLNIRAVACACVCVNEPSLRDAYSNGQCVRVRVYVSMNRLSGMPS